jgi:uncharacterized membrane protein YhaH (DUF805 family)
MTTNTNPFFSNFFSRFFWEISGRIDRRQYWTFFGIMMGYSIMILSTIIVGKEFGLNKDLLLTILVVGYIPLMWSGIVTSIKRIRDTGLSPWWYCLQLAPYLGLVAAITFAVTPTDYFLRFKKPQVVTA